MSEQSVVKGIKQRLPTPSPDSQKGILAASPVGSPTGSLKGLLEPNQKHVGIIGHSPKEVGILATPTLKQEISSAPTMDQSQPVISRQHSSASSGFEVVGNKRKGSRARSDESSATGLAAMSLEKDLSLAVSMHNQGFNVKKEALSRPSSAKSNPPQPKKKMPNYPPPNAPQFFFTNAPPGIPVPHQYHPPLPGYPPPPSGTPPAAPKIGPPPGLTAPLSPGTWPDANAYPYIPTPPSGPPSYIMNKSKKGISKKILSMEFNAPPGLPLPARSPQSSPGSSKSGGFSFTEGIEILEQFAEIIKYGCAGSVTISDVCRFMSKNARLSHYVENNQVTPFLEYFCRRFPEFKFDVTARYLTEKRFQVYSKDIKERMCELLLSEQELQVMRRVQKCCVKVFGVHINIYPFGSRFNGFGCSQSDIDLVLRLESQQDADVNKAIGSPRLYSALIEEGFQVVEQRLQAKIPILLLKLGNFEIDLSCNNTLPIFNTILLHRYFKICPHVAQVAREVRDWARANNIHGALDGNLSSYSFNLMTIFYFQCRGAFGSLQSNCGQFVFTSETGSQHNVAMTWREANNAVASTLNLEDFLKFYKNDFPWGKSVVSIRVGKMVPADYFPRLKTKNDWSETCIDIEDPFDLERNLNVHVWSQRVNALRAAFNVDTPRKNYTDKPLAMMSLSEVTSFQRGDTCRVRQFNPRNDKLPQKVLGAGYFGVRILTPKDGIFCVQPEQLYAHVPTTTITDPSIRIRNDTPSMTPIASAISCTPSQGLSFDPPLESPPSQSKETKITREHTDPWQISEKNKNKPYGQHEEDFGSVMRWYMRRGLNAEDAEREAKKWMETDPQQVLYWKKKLQRQASAMSNTQEMQDQKHETKQNLLRYWLKKGLAHNVADWRAKIDIERQTEEEYRTKKPHEQLDASSSVRREYYIGQEIQLKETKFDEYVNWFAQKGFGPDECRFYAYDYWAVHDGQLLSVDKSKGKYGRKCKYGLRVFVHGMEGSPIQDHSEGVLIEFDAITGEFDVGFGQMITHHDGFPSNRCRVKIENVIRACSN